jgi:predicted glycoside hydrolase/deacetylase ChbG (UPF0249 family)
MTQEGLPAHAAAPASFTRIVLCADDYAVHAPASLGIVALAEAGRISATSAMVLSPRWPEDATLLRPAAGRIDVGLHLDFTSEFARMTLPAAMLRGVAGGFDIARARTEIDAQLDAFEAHWQAPPDHVDGHQHVHQFAGVREALVEAIARRYPRRKPWLRIAHAVGGGLKGRVVTALGAARLARLARAAGIPCSSRLSGLYGFDAQPTGYARRMDRWLASVSPGTVIMCHPAASPAPTDAIGDARQREFEHLGGAEFQAALARHRVRLATGTELFASPA